MLVILETSDDTGDWFQSIEYCFRSDGSLARISATFNTFVAHDPETDSDGAEASRVRERWFDGDGQQLESTERMLDLKTKRPAPRLEIGPPDLEEPIYKTKSSLPFAALLDTSH